jgi:hypothetical protein
VGGFVKRASATKAVDGQQTAWKSGAGIWTFEKSAIRETLAGAAGQVRQPQAAMGKGSDGSAQQQFEKSSC